MPMRYWQVPRLWAGETALLLGGGPSLKALMASPAWASLPRPDVRVVAINRAVEVAPWADLHFAADDAWYRGFARTLDGFAGLRVTTARGKLPEGVKRLGTVPSRTGLSGPLPPACSPSSDRLGGICSGGRALDLARLLGCRKVLLAGYDFKAGPKAETHWHDGYGPRLNARDRDKWGRDFMPAIERMAPALAALGIEVVNLNPDSRLRCFRFVSIERALGTRLAVAAE